jgi:hypothetical protein
MGLFSVVMDPYPDLQKFSFYYLDISLLSLLVRLHVCFAVTVDDQEYLGSVKVGRDSRFEKVPLAMKVMLTIPFLRKTRLQISDAQINAVDAWP